MSSEVIFLRSPIFFSFIYASLEPHPVLILKNMCYEGYSAPENTIINREDVIMIFERIAQFHAASYHLVEDLGEDFTEFSSSLFHNREHMDVAFAKRIRILKDVVATWEGFEDYVPRLEYIAKHAADIGSKCCVKNNPGNGYNVLIHGDLHSNNILVRFNSTMKQLEDFQFVILTFIYKSP
jgi:hypothetical protein